MAIKTNDTGNIIDRLAAGEEDGHDLVDLYETGRLQRPWMERFPHSESMLTPLHQTCLLYTSPSPRD